MGAWCRARLCTWVADNEQAPLGPPPPHTPPLLQADILLAPGSHASEAAVNKQLADKERVAAALENPNLLQMVDRCLGSSSL